MDFAGLTLGEFLCYTKVGCLSWVVQFSVKCEITGVKIMRSLITFLAKVVVLLFGGLIVTGAKLTPQEYAAKQARNLKAATQDIERGVNRVSRAPGQAAAEKKDKMRQNLLQSIDDGTWETNVSAISTDEWKRRMVTKGIPRIATGIDEAKAKVEKFASELLPFEDALKSEIASMPDLSESDRDNRMLAWSRGMRRFRKRG